MYPWDLESGLQIAFFKCFRAALRHFTPAPAVGREGNPVTDCTVFLLNSRRRPFGRVVLCDSLNYLNISCLWGGLPDAGNSIWRGVFEFPWGPLRWMSRWTRWRETTLCLWFFQGGWRRTPQCMEGRPVFLFVYAERYLVLLLVLGLFPLSKVVLEPANYDLRTLDVRYSLFMAICFLWISSSLTANRWWTCWWPFVQVTTWIRPTTLLRFSRPTRTTSASNQTLPLAY